MTYNYIFKGSSYCPCNDMALKDTVTIRAKQFSSFDGYSIVCIFNMKNKR